MKKLLLITSFFCGVAYGASPAATHDWVRAYVATNSNGVTADWVKKYVSENTPPKISTAVFDNSSTEGVIRRLNMARLQLQAGLTNRAYVVGSVVNAPQELAGVVLAPLCEGVYTNAPKGVYFNADPTLVLELYYQTKTYSSLPNDYGGRLYEVDSTNNYIDVFSTRVSDESIRNAKGEN